jgi:hypothetical protein
MITAGIILAVLIVCAGVFLTGSFFAGGGFDSEELAGLFGGETEATTTARETATARARRTATARAEATATARAEATATTLAAYQADLEALKEQGTLVVQDAFVDNRNDWDLGESDDGLGSHDISDGVLSMLVSPGFISWHTMSGEIQEFVAQVDLAIISGSRGGIIFAELEESENSSAYYLATVDNQGYYTLELRQGGEWEVLKRWSEHPAIRQSSNTNTINVVYQDETLQLFVNVVLIYERPDYAIPAGRVGIAGGVFDDVNRERGKIVFDNLRVWELP